MEMPKQKMYVVIAKSERPFMAYFSYDEGDNKQLALDYAKKLAQGGGEVNVYLYEGPFLITIPEAEKGHAFPPISMTFNGTLSYEEQIVA